VPVTFAYVKVAGTRAQHGGTGTHPEYRGRGLATAAKRYVLRAAAANGVTRITTSNAEENVAGARSTAGWVFDRSAST
jgi:RimJ/RimL family protein N-acetyltransferase